MILKSDEIVRRLAEKGESRLVLKPVDRDGLSESGSSAVDLRLGTRFLSTKHSRCRVLDIEDQSEDINKEYRLMDSHYVPFGREYILHPRDFVLGVTLEWIKFPVDLAGYVQGRSSWGRKGLVIATAVGVHSGFNGCLTLEISNLGEVPIAIYPGMAICQLFIHKVKTSDKKADVSPFIGKTRPVLGRLAVDRVAGALSAKDS